jgi:hypothetical protein
VSRELTKVSVRIAQEAKALLKEVVMMFACERA